MPVADKVITPVLLMLASPDTVAKVGTPPVSPIKICPLLPTVVVAKLPLPLPITKALVVKLDWPLPPFCTGSIPATSLPRLTMPVNKSPAEVARITPAVKVEIVVEPVTFKLAVVVEPKAETPAVKPASVVVPLTFKLPLMTWLPVVVAFPATVNDCRLAGPLTVKLVTVVVAKAVTPWTFNPDSKVRLPVSNPVPATVSVEPGVVVPRPKRWLTAS